MTATDTGPTAPEPAPLDVEQVGVHVEQLLDRLAAADGPTARLGEELVRSLVGLYGAALERIVATIAATAPDVVASLAADPVVGPLLSLHDLHPVGVAERVQAALDEVRPFLGSHGGDVTLLGVDDGVVHLRLEGTCNGCGSSQVTLEHAVEAAIHEAAPEVVDIEVEGAVPAPVPTGGLIPLESLRRCPTELEGAVP